MEKLIVKHGRVDLLINKMDIAIDSESVNIYIDNGDEEEPIHVCYWHIDEVHEDPSVSISMCKAVQLFYLDRVKLLTVLGLI